MAESACVHIGARPSFQNVLANGSSGSLAGALAFSFILTLIFTLLPFTLSFGIAWGISLRLRVSSFLMHFDQLTEFSHADLVMEVLAIVTGTSRELIIVTQFAKAVPVNLGWVSFASARALARWGRGAWWRRRRR